MWSGPGVDAVGSGVDGRGGTRTVTSIETRGLGGAVMLRKYWRITDSCLELSVRLLTTSRGVREVKDRITRQLLDTLDGAEIGLAPSSVQVVGTTRLQVQPP